MISYSQWVAWIGATVAAALTMMGYVHSNFVTVREKQTIEYRLERIENKIDELLRKTR